MKYQPENFMRCASSEIASCMSSTLCTMIMGDVMGPAISNPRAAMITASPAKQAMTSFEEQEKHQWSTVLISR
jgi:hypothetical protein